MPAGSQSFDTPIIFEEINTGLIIQKIALKCAGAHGPSASECNQLCIRTSFGTASNDLCSAITAATSQSCVSYSEPCCLSAFVACRLIALNKCPEVHPI